MSLSSWFRDYLYVPLGGSRVSPARTYVNLVSVFFLCGLWHGASWNFVVWGLWHGLFLVVERLMERRQPAGRSPQQSGIQSWPIWPHVYTMLVVMIGWVFFRADTLGGAVGFLKAMAGMGLAKPWPYSVVWFLKPDLIVALAAGLVGSTPWVPVLARAIETKRPALTGAAAFASVTTMIVLLVASMMQVASGTYNPFIYFRF
jgi:alginate O-acetyltransferase complex protein AlgI